MKLVPLAIIAATAGLATAGLPATVTIDVSDAQFFDDQGAAVNTILHIMIGDGINIATITNISWDVNLTTFTDPNASFPSWASEATMLFAGVEMIAVGTADGFGVVNQNYIGNIDTNIELGVDGILDIEFFESFDDAAGFADAQFEAGSILTLHGYASPSPGTLAAFGALGLFTSRRKRK